MELVVLTVGFTEGVLDGPLYSELVIVALATTMMTGPLLDLLDRRGGPRPLLPAQSRQPSTKRSSWSSESSAAR